MCVECVCGGGIGGELRHRMEIGVGNFFTWALLLGERCWRAGGLAGGTVGTDQIMWSHSVR